MPVAALSLLLLATSPAPETFSLLKKPLYRPLLSPEQQKEFEAKLQEAKAVYDRSPEDSEAIIWLGRRTAYLGMYQQSIEIFTAGIGKHPDNAKLYRHRGHRYLTVREIDKAIRDLEKAAALTRNKTDEVEPDGLPNEKNIPRSTLKSNIWYHLGLAYYLKHNFTKAEDAYRECMRWSKNDDMLTATLHWLYMTLRRQNKAEEAAKILEPVTEKMDIIENDEYHKLLLVYKGLKKLEEIQQAQKDDLSNATLAYGIGNWHLYSGRTEEAFAVFEKIVAGAQWPSFGYLAAEAELAALDR